MHFRHLCMDATGNRRVSASEPGLCAGHRPGAWSCRRRSRATDHDPAGAGAQRDARADQHAIDQHVCVVSNQSSVSRRCRGLLGTPAGQRAHRRCQPARRGRSRARRSLSAGVGNLSLHARVRYQEPDGIIGVSTLGHPAGAAAGPRCCGRRQFRRLHPAVQARPGPDRAPALRAGYQRRRRRPGSAR